MGVKGKVVLVLNDRVRDLDLKNGVKVNQVLVIVIVEKYFRK